MEQSDAEDNNVTAMPPSGEQPLCDPCKADDKDIAAIWQCLDCDKHMCQLCYDIHVDFGGGGDCHVVKLGDAIDAAPLPDNEDTLPCSNGDVPSSDMSQEPIDVTETGDATTSDATALLENEDTSPCSNGHVPSSNVSQEHTDVADNHTEYATTSEVVNPTRDDSEMTVPSEGVAQVVVSDDENEINHTSTQEVSPSNDIPAAEETSQKLDSPPAGPPATTSPLNVKQLKTIQVKKSSTQARTVNEVSAVAVDDNTQEIYVVSHSSKLVMRFKADGTFVRKFASQGTNKVKEPWDVAILPNGNIAITDKEEKVLKLYNNTNRLLKVFKDVAEPRGVATDPIGNIYVADQETHNIYVFQETHKSCIKVIKPSGCTLISPDFLAINGKKELIVSDAGDDTIKVLSTADQEASLLFQYGSRGSDWHQLKVPRGVIANSRFEIFVADCYNDRVIVLNTDGSYKQTLLTSVDGLVEPQGLEMTKDGKLIVATRNGDLLIYQVKKQSGFCVIL